MKRLVLLFAAAITIGSLTGCESAEEKAKKEAEWEKWRAESRAAEQAVERAREEGRRALEAADNAILRANADIKAELEKKAVAHRSSTPGNGTLRVDVYEMPDGQLITCTTKVFSNGAPIVQCDGHPNGRIS
jgi:hypothetical protein